MLNRAARQATKLINVNMMAYIGPDPLDEEPFQPLAEEWGQSKISQLILRLGLWNFVDGEVMFFLVGFGPAV